MSGFILMLIGTHLLQTALSCSLVHNGYCLPEYTVISAIALTENNPLYCMLGEGGQWIGPNNTPVKCDGSGSGPFTCSRSSDSKNITLYRKLHVHVEGLLKEGKQLYTCTSTGKNISIQIEDNTVLSAIYIEPPVDVTIIPQNYTIHCIITGQSSSDVTVGMFLERHGQSYYNVVDSPVEGYSQVPPLLNILKSANPTYDYSEEVVWRADRTEFDRTEFDDQGLTKYNADHDWACRFDYPKPDEYEDLQTYIRAPNFAPTNLTVNSHNSTSVTIDWIAVNSTDADGYIIYISHQYSDTQSTVTIGNTTQYTLLYKLSLPLYGYIITVRAHQDLLGPASEPIVIPTIDLALTSLTCNYTNSKVIAVGLSTPHSLPREGLSYQVKYSGCDSASLKGSFNTTNKTIIVRDLSPNTCYEFTITPKFAKPMDSEAHSIQCSTLPKRYYQNENEVIIAVLTTLTIAVIILSAFALLIIVVVLVVKRIQRHKPTHFLQQTQRKLCEMRTNMTYSEEGYYVNDDYPAGCCNENTYNDFVAYEEVKN